jgi:hypothetical protein
LSRKGFSAHWQTRLSLVRVNPDKPRSRGQSALVVCRRDRSSRARRSRQGCAERACRERQMSADDPIDCILSKWAGAASSPGPFIHKERFSGFKRPTPDRSGD